MDTLVTTTPFDATSSTAVAVTTTPGDAVLVVNTDGSGDVIAVGTNTPGTTYSVGDTIALTEDGGAGEATARVASIS